jgi:hypothetical protein
MTGQEEFFRRLVTERHPLPDAVLAFQRLLPGRLAPEAVRAEALPLLPLLREPQAAARMLDRVFLLLPPARRQAGVSPQDEAAGHTGSFAEDGVWSLDFRTPRHRLILLPPDMLLRLARWCGLVRYRTEAARLIEAASVRALRDEVGEEGRYFVLRRSRLLPGQREETDANGDLAGMPLAERIRKGGFDIVAACLEDAPQKTRVLFRCVLPRELAARFPPEPESSPAARPEKAARFWPLTRAVLFKEVAPAWEPCFA